MNVKDKIIEISKLLDELDTFAERVPLIEQNFDYKKSDLYHKLMTMKLNSKNCYRFCKELKNVLLERADFKNNVALSTTYRDNKAKLNNGKENRQMLLAEIGKREKKLNQPYKNRVYTEEELLEKIGE